MDISVFPRGTRVLSRSKERKFNERKKGAEERLYLARKNSSLRLLLLLPMCLPSLRDFCSFSLSLSLSLFLFLLFFPRFKELTEAKQKLKGLSNIEKLRSVENELEEISQKMRESNKELCRSLKQNPNIQVHQDTTEKNEHPSDREITREIDG